MFQPVFGIFGCNNVFDCIEKSILAILSTSTIYLFITAYVLIRKDQAQILDKTDKMIFYLASVHSGLLSLTLLIYTHPFLTYTIRVLYLILDIVICTVVAYMYFSQDMHQRISKVRWIALTWALVLWFVSVVDLNELSLENECNLANTLMFSISDSCVSFVLLLCGYGSIQIINEVERRQSISSSDAHDLWIIRRFQELRERKIQIITLTVVNVIAAFFELVWDIKKHDVDFTKDECDRLSFAHNFFDMIVFTVLEILCNLLPSWGIYYLYYWRNREHFRSASQNFNRHLNDFDELRSDMLELS